MSWEEFYLIAFLVGLMLSVISMLTAGLGLHAFGHHHGHVGGLGHHHHGGSLLKGGAGKDAIQHGTEASFFSFATMTAFLAWFGGSGYLLTHYSALWAWTALGLAIACGLFGAYLVFSFLAKLLSREKVLDQADFDMIGVLGKVNSGVRAGGTGEMIFSQAGVRRTCGIRSEDGVAIPRGTEVVVTRYERGLAYVRPWEDALNGGPSHLE